MIFSLTERLRWKNYIVLLVVSIEKYKILKYYTFSKQNIGFFYYLKLVRNRRWKNVYRKKINWDIENSWSIYKNTWLL